MSDETVAAEQDQSRSERPRAHRVYFYVALLAVGVLAAYWRSMYWVTSLSLLHADTGGGLFAPLVSAYLVWHKRDELRGLKPTRTHWGALALTLGLVLFVGGLWGRFASALTLSLVTVIWGLVVWMGGLELGKKLVFPIGYLAFLVPAPSLLDQLTVPARLLAAQISAILPRALGLPTQVEGTELLVGNFRAMIDAPCSGMAYLLAMLACATLVAYLSNCSMTRKVLLSLSAIPIAMVANVVRILMTFLLHDAFGGVFSAGVGHFMVGIAVFFFATLSLLGVWTVTCRDSTGAS